MNDTQADTAFSSAAYWEARYAAGGNSGAGSYGRLAEFKAAFLNGFFRRHSIKSIIDFGCGDGNQLSLLDGFETYTGVDVSETVLAKCRKSFAEPRYKFVGHDALVDAPMACLTMSIDTTFNLVEDDVFENYMRNLFGRAEDFVILYTSDHEGAWPAPHVRHRNCSDYIARMFPEWRLLEKMPNLFPFDPNHQEQTSFCDFYVYERNSLAQNETRQSGPSLPVKAEGAKPEGKPMQPLMSEKEASLFEVFLRHCTDYVEFGAGGSTVLASGLVKRSIISVDSSRRWLDSVTEACRCKPVQPQLLYTDIGPTREWGYPDDPESRPHWPAYHEAVWRIKEAADADLFLVDGRFRVASFAQVILHCQADAIICFHDFASRPPYHIVREIAREIASADDISFFLPRPDARARAMQMLESFRFDPG